MKVYDWAAFFSEAKKMTGIKKMQQFVMSSDKPGESGVTWVGTGTEALCLV